MLHYQSRIKQPYSGVNVYCCNSVSSGPAGTGPASGNNNKGLGSAQENVEQIISSQWVQSSPLTVQCSCAINRVAITHTMTANRGGLRRTNIGLQTIRRLYTNAQHDAETYPFTPD